MRKSALAKHSWLPITLVLLAASSPHFINRIVRAKDVRAAGRRISALTDRLQNAPVIFDTGTRGAPTWLSFPSASGVAGGTLTSWQTFGGCGAGASSGSGAGIKWIGRSVSGGLFQVQCQGNYGPLDDGYFYATNTLVNRDVGEKWNLGVNAAWLYKYWNDPTGLGYDISNQGWGDVAVMLTRRLGAINATSVTATVGLPTGGYKAASKGYVLRQDKQMGHGKVTGGLMVDHVFDNLWGPWVVGGTIDYRGGENAIKNYRSPAASAYSYAGYLLGPFVPAAGLTLSGFQSNDRDQDRAQDRPRITVAANASIEWATDWIALLVGGSLPFDAKGNRQPWVAGAGLSLSPF